MGQTVANIVIDLADFGAETHSDDHVLMWAPVMRGSASRADGIVSTAQRRIPLVDGQASVEDVEPGPLNVIFQCRGVADTGVKSVTVPEDMEEVSLRLLLESNFTYSPAIVSSVQQAAQEAATARNQTLEARNQTVTLHQEVHDRVDASLNNAASLVRDEVRDDADRAEGAATVATTQAGLAQQHMEAAEQYKLDAESAAGTAASDTAAAIQSDMQGLVSAAEGYAQDANQSAASAGTHATASSQDAQAVAQTKQSIDETVATVITPARAQVEADRTAVDTLRSEVAADKATITDAVTVVAQHEQTTLGYRNESEAFRDQAQAAAENAQQGAPSDGWKKAELSQSVQDSLSRADTALQSMPVATEQAPGAIRLTGDLGGTAQAPTVPGLAGKADAVHTHASSQVDGLDAALARLSNIRAWFRGAGAPPASIPGAQVGDWWLDTDTMELHEITGV